MDDIPLKLPPHPVRFFDQLREHMRTQGLAYRTEQTYCLWIKRFILFHQKQHPKNLSEIHIEAFLTHLSVNRHCSVNTQKIALNSVIYLYKRFFGLSLNQLEFSPGKTHRRLPVIYSKKEISNILSHLKGSYQLMVEILYGAGLRKAELLSLRIKDIDFENTNITIRFGKGGKDRITLLPKKLIQPIQQQIEQFGRAISLL
jgi:integrase